MEFSEAYEKFWTEIGANKKMVLSSCQGDAVSSRTMSVIILNEKFYFQTDRTSRKYRQLKGNCNVALCVDNIQVEGICVELGHPHVSKEFCAAYRKYFPGSYGRYSSLENERLFHVLPAFVERWIYVAGVPYMETFDIINKQYALERYIGV